MYHCIYVIRRWLDILQQEKGGHLAHHLERHELARDEPQAPWRVLGMDWVTLSDPKRYMIYATTFFGYLIHSCASWNTSHRSKLQATFPAGWGLAGPEIKEGLTKPYPEGGHITNKNMFYGLSRCLFWFTTDITGFLLQKLRRVYEEICKKK